MANISYLTYTAKMDYHTIIKLPITVFFSYLKHFRIFDLQQTPEGVELLKQNNRLRQKEPDWDRLREKDNYRVE